MDKHLSHYMAATWRGTTSVHLGEIAVSFDTPDGVVRLRLPVDSASHLAGSIRGFLPGGDPCLERLNELLHEQRKTSDRLEAFAATKEASELRMKQISDALNDVREQGVSVR